MNYIKRIEKVQLDFSTLVQEFGPDGDDLMAVFQMEKKLFQRNAAKLDHIIIDTNFISTFKQSKIDTVMFISHAFNISDMTELEKALEQEENQHVLELEIFADSFSSVQISAKSMTGKELLAMMRGHVAILYSLHYKLLESKHISGDSHRPSSLEYSPIRIFNNGLEFRLFDYILNKNDLLKKLVLLANMYKSSKSGESALEFISKFFSNGDFERYGKGSCDVNQKEKYKNLSVKFLEYLINNNYKYNTGKTDLLRYFCNQ